MSRLSLYFLGPPRIEKDGLPVEINRKKAVALIAYLALTKESYSRDRLATLLWPEYDQSRARAALRRILSALKAAIGSGWLDVERETIGLNRSGGFWSDVDYFHSLLVRCGDHGHSSDEACSECVKPLTEAVRLYQDDFLSGFSLQDSVDFDDWQFLQAQSLRSEMIGGLERLVNWHNEQGELKEAIGYTRRWLEMDRTNEVAHRRLMELYARSGYQAAALRQYDEFVRVLERESGKHPHEKTVKLYEAIKDNKVAAKVGHPDPDLSAHFPPLKSLDIHLNNLPRQLTNFVGREQEMAEIKKLLATTPLLTLTGSGGCGKTRLALQVAAEVLEEYEDGVWLVELASLSDPDLIPQTVASSLGVSEQPGRPILAMLLDYLRSKKILLVIDNCEHLIGACAQIVENLLRACPDLRVLATSRERLGIGGETAWRVPSLSLPDFGSRPPIESLRQYEAVRLFIDRATSAVPGFMVTDQNAPEVAQICHRLDGIPLAIELAAARVKALSVEQIVERLDDRFRLLTGGSRTALPRHQTLRATIDWSYELLNEAEKVLLRRLSAFAGGWTLPAAEVVCTDGIHRSEVVDLLTHLVDKSLVVVEERGKEVRYKLLEMVRQYGREKLIEAEEESILSRRHREWYLGLAERAEPELWGRDQVMWLDQLEAEHDNLRAALGWSLESGEIEVGLQLAGALWRFWFIRGYLSEGRRRLEKALSHSSVASASVRAKALTGAGGLAWRQGDYRRAEALLEEGLTLFRELGYKRGIALSLRLLGHIALDQSDYERATVLGAESLALRRELGHKGDVARSLSFLGVVALRQCDYDLARALIEECLDLLRELGIKGNIAWSLKDLGLIARNQKDHSRAAVLLEESLDLFRGLGDKQGISQCLEVLGGVAVAQGQQERAAVLYKESLALCRELGDKWNIAQCLEGLARVAETEGQSERAAQLFSAAEALREALDTPLPPSDHTEYDRSVAAVCAGLGEETFRLAWEEGRKMALEQAIEYALSD